MSGLGSNSKTWLDWSLGNVNYYKTLHCEMVFTVRSALQNVNTMFNKVFVSMLDCVTFSTCSF